MNQGPLAIATFGGPTAVLNRTIEGFVEEAGRRGPVFGILGGPVGFAEGAIRELTGMAVADAPPWSCPGSWLGAGRRQLDDAVLDRGIGHLTSSGIRGLAVVGGNGTMHCCQRMVDRARVLGASLDIVGVPKTIDNDLWGTDRSPGYASAASFVADMVANLAFDHRAMRSIERVRIVETLGRNTGWLALSALLARDVTGSEPHMVVLPEDPFDGESFVAAVDGVLHEHDRAFVVVAEGAAGAFVADRFETARYDRPIEGGVAHLLAQRLRQGLGVTVRAEVPGLIQRCAATCTTAVDRRDARIVGEAAARYLAQGVTGVMVVIRRDDVSDGDGGRGTAGCTGPSAVPLVATVPLSDVAGRTRHVPDEWLPGPAADGCEAFLSWARPLTERSAADHQLLAGRQG